MFQTTLLRSAYRKASHFQHDEDSYASWALLAAEEGSFAYELVGRESGEAAAGDVVFCPPGVVLRRRALTPVIVFHFAEFDSREVTPQAGRQTPSDTSRLWRMLLELHRLAASRDDERAVWVPHLLHDIVYQCGCLRRLTVRPAPVSDDLMEQAHRFLEANYSRDDLSLHSVAKVSGLSAVQFTRRFRAAYNQTPSDYVKRRRLDHAHELILNTQGPLAEIAEICGYRDAFYLSRVFKAAYGVAPAHYRNRHRV